MGAWVGRPPEAGSCSNFLYVFKAARNGPLTPPPGRELGPPLSLWAESRKQPVGWRGSAESGRCDDRAPGYGEIEGIRPAADRHGSGDAAQLLASCRRARGGPVVGCGNCASGGGTPALGWPRTPSPSARGKPSRTPPAPASLSAGCQGRLDAAGAGGAPLPQSAGRR